MPHKISVIWPSQGERIATQSKIAHALASAIGDIAGGPAAPISSSAQIRRALAKFDFHTPMPVDDAATEVIELLKRGTVHMMHPGYSGLFNPSVTFPGMVADQITAAINPQLAVWSHAAVAVEIERHTIDAVAGLLGWIPDQAAGHFTTGGAEANYTAVLIALTRLFPEFGSTGARALPAQPRLYVSAESHLAWLKIAHQAGIGRESVCLVGTDGMGRMSAASLRASISADRQNGRLPFFVGATAGTTNAGMIDPLEDCNHIAHREGLWLHVDAAWGGAGLMSPRVKDRLAGIQAADSVTIDAHKWFAVPMGAGMFLCRENALLGDTFRVSTGYMPTTEAAVDPHTHSVQWSRRFIGLKLFLSLACLGWEGYRAHIEHALDMSNELRTLLAGNGWRVVNDSPLAVTCFTDEQHDADPIAVAEHVVASGNAWISTAQFEGKRVLRACITSHLTRREYLAALMAPLTNARDDALAHRM